MDICQLEIISNDNYSLSMVRLFSDLMLNIDPCPDPQKPVSHA